MLSLAFALELYWLGLFGPVPLPIAVGAQTEAVFQAEIEKLPMLVPKENPVPGAVVDVDRGELPPKVYSLSSIGRAHCDVPADITPDPSINFVWEEDAAPADLPGPQFALPETFAIDLELFMGRPAPFGSSLQLGQAEFNVESGGVRINGESFGPAPLDYP